MPARDLIGGFESSSSSNTNKKNKMSTAPHNAIKRKDFILAPERNNINKKGTYTYLYIRRHEYQPGIQTHTPALKYLGRELGIRPVFLLTSETLTEAFRCPYRLILVAYCCRGSAATAPDAPCPPPA